MKQITYKVRDICKPPKEKETNSDKLKYGTTSANANHNYNAGIKEYGDKRVSLNRKKLEEVIFSCALDNHNGLDSIIVSEATLENAIASNLKSILKEEK